MLRYTYIACLVRSQMIFVICLKSQNGVLSVDGDVKRQQCGGASDSVVTVGLGFVVRSVKNSEGNWHFTD